MTQTISSLLTENRLIRAPSHFSSKALISSDRTYQELYQRSISDPESFWAELAANELVWERKWSKVLEYDFKTIGDKQEPYLSWFKDGLINISANCLDRHLHTWRRNKAAIIWQGEPEHEKSTLTYQELYHQVCRFANVLKAHGITKGSTVTIFMPMVPEIVIALLACARIGAIHSVVFSAFSAEALKSRILDCHSELVITADIGYHAGKSVELKTKVDDALLECPSVKKVILYDRGHTSPPMEDGRDYFWHKEMLRSDVSNDCPAIGFDSETPLFILYTSGSTGKPKGVLHTTAGYLLHTHSSFKYFFDHKDDDLFWCTADVGWITGHSYLVYGPLSNGATCMMYEGTPLYPNPERFWKIISDYKVTVFYTAPTAIRMLMKFGDDLPNRYDLSSLRLLGSVGEPINPEAWMWYYKTIGKEKCPIIDTWWQTETGGIMISTMPGAVATKPGSAGKPFFGIVPKIYRENGSEANANEGGSVVIEKPWPGMLRGVYGDAKNEIIKRVYFSKFDGVYFTGDGGRKDEDDYTWLMGRIDDVLNVSAHRLATAELESALVSYSAVAEAAVVGFPHDTKGQGIHCFVVLKSGNTPSQDLVHILRGHVRKEIGPIATPDRIQFTDGLPKTRSGKIMRRILRKIAEGSIDEIGDVSTLADPSVVDALISGFKGLC